MRFSGEWGWQAENITAFSIINHRDWINIECFRKTDITFHSLISWPILIQMISNFNTMWRNNSKFYVYLFFFSRYRNTIHQKRKAVLCVWVCSNTFKQDYAPCIWEFTKHSPTAMQIWTWHKKFKSLSIQGKIPRWPSVLEEMVKWVQERFWWNHSWNPHSFEFHIQILMNKSYFVQH